VPVKVASLENNTIKWKNLSGRGMARTVSNPEDATIIWVEALKPKAKGKFTIKLDSSMLNRFKDSLGFTKEQLSLLDLEKSFDLINRWFLKVKRREGNFWMHLEGFSFYQDTLKFYKSKETTTILTIRLGWGTGFREMTVTEKYGEEMVSDVKRIFYPKTRSNIFPKTRRVAFQGKYPWMPFGWVRAKIRTH